MKDLTTRQWELYKFLKDNYSEEEYIPKKVIIENISSYEIKENETRLCRDIEFDVRDINNNDKIPKIIVSSSKGYKIGNPEQVHDYLTSREISAKESLKLTFKMRHKAELNGQYRIQFGKGERNIIETYLIKEQMQNDKKDNN